LGPENFDAKHQHNEIKTTPVEVAQVENAAIGAENEIATTRFSKHGARFGVEPKRQRRRR
jgi:hypothetical protein